MSISDTPNSIGDARLGRMLNYDAIAEAEIECGVNIDQDPLVMAVAFNNQLDSSDWKKKALTANRDTYFGAKLDYLIEIYAENGFEIVLDEHFERINTYGDHKGVTIPERLLVWAHRDGLILIDQTYSWIKDDGSFDVSMNVGHVHFNYQSDNLRAIQSLLCSGGFVHDEDLKAKAEDYRQKLRDANVPFKDSLWDQNPYELSLVRPYVKSGYFDTREGMFHTIKTLKKNGKFLTKWIENPINWIITTEENERDPFVPGSWDIWKAKTRELTLARVAKMPEWVREMIGEFK